MNVGEKIKELRNRKGFSQKELGHLSNTSESTIRKYELGQRNPKIETIQKLSNALGSNELESKTIYTSLLEEAGYLENDISESPFVNGGMALPILLAEQKVDDKTEEIISYDRDLNTYVLEDIFTQVSREITLDGQEISHENALIVLDVIRSLKPLLKNDE